MKLHVHVINKVESATDVYLRPAGRYVFTPVCLFVYLSPGYKKILDQFSWKLVEGLATYQGPIKFLLNLVEQWMENV